MSEHLPKLLVFAPCERVVIGEERDNSASLIAILQGFQIASLAAPEVPLTSPKEPGVIPMAWYVFTLWESDRTSHEYVQRFEMRSPSGRVLAKAESAFTFGNGKRFQRVNVRLVGFPIDGLGDYTVHLFLKSGNSDWVERGVFPIPITPELDHQSS